MKYQRDKILTSCPLYIPEYKILVISYDNISEVLDEDNKIIWKIQFEANTVSLHEIENDNTSFYVGLENGKIQKVNLVLKSIEDIIELPIVPRKIFISENHLLSYNKEIVIYYNSFNVTSKQILSSKRWNIVEFNDMAQNVVMVTSKEILMKFINSDKQKFLDLSENFKKFGNIRSLAIKHNESLEFATGHTSGRIVIWRDFMNDVNKITVLHWHFQTVQCISFDMTGDYLFSGGKEHVLVKWDMTGENKKYFYPRLESSMACIKPAKRDSVEDYKCILFMDDNSCQILNQKMDSVIRSYRGFGQRYPYLHKVLKYKSNTNPVGLVQGFYLPGKYNGNVITNVHEGKLQFIDPISFSVELFDVAYQNWPVPREEHMVPRFTQVVNVAIGECGTIMATVERNVDGFEQQLGIFEWTDNAYWDLRRKIEVIEMGKITGLVILPGVDKCISLITENLDIAIVRQQSTDWKIASLNNLTEFIPKLYSRHYGEPLINYAKITTYKEPIVIVAKYKYLSFWPVQLMEPLFTMDISLLKSKMNLNVNDRNNLRCTIFSMGVISKMETNIVTMVIGCSTGCVIFDLDISNRVPNNVTGFLTKDAVTSVSISPSNKVAMSVTQKDLIIVIPDILKPSVRQSFNVFNASNVAWVPVDTNSKYAVACLQKFKNSKSKFSRLSVCVLNDETVNFDQYSVKTPEFNLKTESKLFDDVEDVEMEDQKPVMVVSNIKKLQNLFIDYKENFESFDVMCEFMYS